ncbi:hypothetical protein PRIPAC_85786 [Pristionchus pacificus]|nr:hypothetical protein PRIPAC_85786 [Pristionchus pacificus]
MTDDSKLVLRWEIANAKARFATGKVESNVFDKGGFEWTMSVEKDTNCDYGVIFALKCDAGHSGSWKCDVVVEVRQYKTNDLDYGVMMVMTRQDYMIKDKIEFLDLLSLIYLKAQKINDRSVVYILKLADRFQMKDVFKLAKMCLTESKGIDVMAKLLVADQYNLSDLKDHCLKSFVNANVLLKKMKAFPEYCNFSGEMKIAICDKMNANMIILSESF